MKTLYILLFALLLSACASIPTAPKQPPRMAIFNDGQIVVGIVDAPCTSAEVKSFIADEFFPRFKSGRVVIKGVGAFDLCWADGEDFADVEPGLKGSILVFDALGNYGPVPANIFFESKMDVLNDQNLRKPSTI